jgi:uncharacterized protein (DUF2252 family)
MLRDVAAEIEKLDAPWTARNPELIKLKRTRMKESSLAFLRASPPVFFVRLREALDKDDPLARWLGGDPDAPVRLVWCAGDVHMENFGGYVRNADGEERFGLNDFDDAVVAPLEIDLLRLAASTFLAARSKGLDGAAAHGLVARLLSRYAGSLDPEAPDPGRREVGSYVGKLLDDASDASRAAFLDKKAPVQHGRRAFVASDRYRPLEGAERARVLAAYAKATEPLVPEQKPGFYDPIDVTARVAGLGSLGCGRYAILIHGGAKANGLLELKEAKPASLARHGCPQKGMDEADRVVSAQIALRGERSPHLSRTTLDGLPYYLRRLYHKEQRVELEDVKADELASIADAEALALARSHARSRKKTLGLPDLARLEAAELQRFALLAGWLAGTVEGDYLAFVSAG